MKSTRYQSKSDPSISYWAEPNGGGGAGAIESYCVVGQAEGYPATEACDDWFANFADADEIARKLAVGEDIG